jgi:hypothetical protein
MAEGMTTTDHNIVSLYSVASLPDEYVFRTCAIDTVTPSSPPRTLSMLQAYCQQIVQFALYCHPLLVAVLLAMKTRHQVEY